MAGITTTTMNLYQKLAAITGEVGVIKKTGRNNEQKFDFIEYAAVAGELRNLFAKYGVIIIPRMQRASKQQRIEITSKYGGKGVTVLIDFYFTVVNADDPSDKFNVQWTGEAADFGDKATNKAATSALKYYLMRQFNISERGEDPDADSPFRGEPITPAPEPERPPVSLVTPSQLMAIEGTARAKGKSQEWIDAIKAKLTNPAGYATAEVAQGVINSLSELEDSQEPSKPTRAETKAAVEKLERELEDSQPKPTTQWDAHEIAKFFEADDAGDAPVKPVTPAKAQRIYKLGKQLEMEPSSLEEWVTVLKSDRDADAAIEKLEERLDAQEAQS